MAAKLHSVEKTNTLEKDNKQILHEVLSLAESAAKEIGMSRTDLDLVKDTYAKNTTDQELALFIKTAARLGLSIEARQIFLVPRWDSKLQREVKTPQISIDGSRLVAERTGKYVPGREPVYEYDGQRLRKATAFVKKFIEGSWHEISAHAFFSEYVQTTKDGMPNSSWTKMPHIMLAKCAESLALRKAFPNELSGVYTDAEMGTDSESSAYPINDEPDKSEIPRRQTKGELIEKTKQRLENEKVNAAIDRNPGTAEALGVTRPDSDFTDEQIIWRNEIKLLARAIGRSNDAMTKDLKRFDENADKREAAFTSSIAKYAVKKIIETKKWPFGDEGALTYLEAFGFTDIEKASRGQLEACIAKMREDTII